MRKKEKTELAKARELAGRCALVSIALIERELHCGYRRAAELAFLLARKAA